MKNIFSHLMFLLAIPILLIFIILGLIEYTIIHFLGLFGIEFEEDAPKYTILLFDMFAELVHFK